jgi:hypothetical protein
MDCDVVAAGRQRGLGVAASGSTKARALVDPELVEGMHDGVAVPNGPGLIAVTLIPLPC